MYTLSAINIYPVKSMGGFTASEAIVQRRGLQYDRRWMVADAAGTFVSQREIPDFALIDAAIEDQHLVLHHRHRPDERLRVPVQLPTDILDCEVAVWGDRFVAQQVAGQGISAVDEWLSDQFGQTLRLIYMPDMSVRPADSRYAPPGQEVSFADGFPFLIIGQASLDALNSRLAAPLPMNRFRPNLVFTGGEPHEEDQWREFRIGDQLFCGVKPCARCQITTIDQASAARGAEPLKTLSAYRLDGNKILFGQNTIWLGEEAGRIKTGDRIEVISVSQTGN